MLSAIVAMAVVLAIIVGLALVVTVGIADKGSRINGYEVRRDHAPYRPAPER